MNFKINRRQFLQYCAASAAALGLSQTDLLKLEKAMATPQTGCSSPTPSVLWFSGQNCSGCQTSLLNRVVDCGGSGYYDGDLLNLLNALYGTGAVTQGTPSDIAELNVVNDAADLVVGDAVNAVVPQLSRNLTWSSFPGGYITVEFMTTVNAGAGNINVDHIGPIVNAGGFFLLIDGTIPTGSAHNEKFSFAFDETANNWTGLGAGTSVTIADALRWMAPQAAAVITVGSCSSFGGVPAAKRNKTGATPVSAFFAANGISTPVIKVPGCPPHPDWIVYPVAYYIIHAALPPVDSKGRPQATFGDVPFCTNCANQVTQGTPDAAQFLSDDGCQAGNGCKGPYSFGDCPVRQKNVFDDGTVNNWCSAGSRGANIAQSRHVCQGCIEPDFPDWASLASDTTQPRTEKGIKGFYNSHGNGS